jgi:uncharacterized membrane protein YkvA (DUF1232 family)
MNPKIKPTTNLIENLAAYKTYAAGEGLNLVRFVERGGRLLGAKAFSALPGGLAALREKINLLRREHPRLRRQLEFLASFFESAPADLPEHVRNETAFALLYAVQDNDLLPDDMPEVGHVDDAAITEIVLSRHAGIFERHCAAHGIEWDGLKPEIQPATPSGAPTRKAKRAEERHEP